jgi:DNA-binding LacI/PurR family transcriptional regulator
MPPSSLDRSPLYAQVADFLRDRIHRKLLPDPLPPERELAASFGISRPVIRQALAVLHRQGIVRIEHGKRTRVLRQRQTRPVRSRQILAAAPFAPTDFFTTHASVLASIRQQMEDRGFTWTELFDRRLASRRCRALLEEQTGKSEPGCVLLIRSAPAMQNWAQDHRFQALVLGTPFPGISLPSIDRDYRALGWHAAGRFVKARHRNVSLLMPSQPAGGDRATHEGMTEYLQSLPNADCYLSIDPVSEQPAAFCASINRILSRTAPPTAFFTFHPRHTLTLLTHLLRRGIRIPDDISIVSRDSAPYLEAVVPELSRYQSNDQAVIGHVVRLIEEISHGVSPKKNQIRVIPTFLEGRTFRSPR